MANVIFYTRTVLTGGGATALDGIASSGLVDGDIAHVSTSDNIHYVYKLSAAAGGTEISPYLITPDDVGVGTKRWILQQSFAALPPGHIYGLEITTGTDADHDLNIAAGSCRDDTDATDIVISSALVKQSDLTFEAGSGGGMNTGESVTSSGTVHVWAIKKTDLSGCDIVLTDNTTSGLTPSLPTGYTYKRRIASYRMNGTVFRTGMQAGHSNLRVFMLDTPVLSDVAGAPGDTAAHTATLHTPTGIVMRAIVNSTGAATGTLYLSSPANADMAPSDTAAPLHSSGGSSGTPGSMTRVFTNTTNGIRFRAGANVAVYVATLGWEDYL